MSNQIHKNQNRNQNSHQHQKYKPQYIEKNITPEEVNFKGNIGPQFRKNDNKSIPAVGNIQPPLQQNSIIDDMEEELDPNHPMIDNNDYVDIDDSIELDHEDSTPPDPEYVLILGDTIIAKDNLSTIEQQVSDLIFGEHKLFPNKKFTTKNILVYKKINIKVGVFLEG